MAKYVDGFVIPIRKSKLAAYQKLAKQAQKVWMEHGALAYYECIGDDMNVKMGVPFPKLAKAKPGETVIFSWIVYKSRKHRDAVNAKVMKDKRISSLKPEDMPFDCNVMAYGGFKTIVDVVK